MTSTPVGAVRRAGPGERVPAHWTDEFLSLAGPRVEKPNPNEVDEFNP